MLEVHTNMSAEYVASIFRVQLSGVCCGQCFVGTRIASETRVICRPLKIETALSSEMLVSVYRVSQHEDRCVE